MQMKHSVEIAASADDAWHVLGVGFGQICEWSTSLSDSTMVGDLQQGGVRQCKSAGFWPFPPSVVTEELTHFDHEEMAFAYVAKTGLPPFVTRATNAWKVEPDGPGHCKVSFHAVIELAWWAAPLGWLMPMFIRSDLAQMTEEMKYRIETGKPHPRVLAA